MSEFDNKYVGEATNYKKKAKKPIWLKWGGIAACLAIAVAIGTLIPRQTTDPIPPNQGGEVMIETSYLNIYYVSENGIIENKSIEVRNTAEDIFNEWAALNNISDVSLVDCIYDNGGTVTTSGTRMTRRGLFRILMTIISPLR